MNDVRRYLIDELSETDYFIQPMQPSPVHVETKVSVSFPPRSVVVLSSDVIDIDPAQDFGLIRNDGDVMFSFIKPLHQSLYMYAVRPTNMADSKSSIHGTSLLTNQPNDTLFKSLVTRCGLPTAI